ncbi:MAG: hypothetical protein JRF33_05290 [Deltaproteobacteria bacterium]|nr:hypothetical protein [Deltaproteobacteria bacterium]
MPAKEPKNEQRIAHVAARKQSRFAWALATATLLLLVALALWMNKLQESTGVVDDEKEATLIPPDPDGGVSPGDELPVAFKKERCRPWHVSTAVAKASPKANFILVNSTLADPYGLVLSGFTKACGSDHPTLVAEQLKPGQLAALIESQKPTALVLVGAASLEKAKAEAGETTWLFAKITDPHAQKLDGPKRIGVSPWVPMAATVVHVLRPLPRSKTRLVVIYPAEMQILAEQAAEAIRADDRKAALMPLESAEDLDELLKLAVERGNAWMVIPDRKLIDHKIFNRIQVAAEKNKIPVLVTDEEHVRAGAYAGVGPDSFRIGTQLCHLAGAIERQELPEGSHIFCPEYSFSVVHLAIVEKLGYMLEYKHLKQAKLYKWH